VVREWLRISQHEQHPGDPIAHPIALRAML
jgi:hypothetical protein